MKTGPYGIGTQAISRMDAVAALAFCRARSRALDGGQRRNLVK
jgi:hypothetical protein